MFGFLQRLHKQRVLSQDQRIQDELVQDHARLLGLYQRVVEKELEHIRRDYQQRDRFRKKRIGLL